MSRKILCITIALLFIMSATITGCSQKSEGTQIIETNTKATVAPSSETPAKKVKITFWDDNAGPERTPLYEELIKRFHAQNSNVEVEYLGIPWESSKQKYDIAIAADEVPDCAEIITNWLAGFVAKDTLLPLDEYFEKWNESDKMAPAYIGALRNVVPDGKLYGLPYTANMSLAWIRSDWLKDAGLDIPKNWDEVFEAIDTLTDKDNNQYGFSFRGGPGSWSPLLTFLYSYSGIAEFYGADGKCTLNDPGNVEALERYVSLYTEYSTEGDITNGYKEITAAFDSGSAAMIIHNLGSYNTHKGILLDDSKFTVLPLPKGKSGKQILPETSISEYGIFKSSEKYDAAWEFISFLCTAESNSYWNSHVGQLPTNTDVLDDEWVVNAKHIQTAASFASQKDTLTLPLPFYLPDYTTINSSIAEPGLQKVMLGDKQPKEFLDEWAKAFEDAKKEYDANN